MRDTIMTFAMIASLIATWWVVHWVARLIVTEYGILVGLGRLRCLLRHGRDDGPSRSMNGTAPPLARPKNSKGLPKTIETPMIAMVVIR